MNPYVGKICPFCKTAFQPDDEIVLCSQCDMPHHKECWAENQGCTTFGCQGTIKAREDTATSVTAGRMAFEGGRPGITVYCTRCGTPSPDTASFCAKCGNRLITVPRPSRPPVYAREAPASYAWGSDYPAGTRANSGPDVAPEIRQLVGSKAEYYIPRFQEMKRRNKRTSWNWAAFLVPPYWMIYRKMYGYGAGVLAAAFVLSLIGSPVLPALSLGGYIALGIFGNSIYLKFLEEKVARARTMDGAMGGYFLQQNSGTNSTAMILTMVGYALLSVIISV